MITDQEGRRGEGSCLKHRIPGVNIIIIIIYTYDCHQYKCYRLLFCQDVHQSAIDILIMVGWLSPLSNKTENYVSEEASTF